MKAIPLLVLVFLGCASVAKSAAKDPMKCERDPACVQRSDKSKDCSTQCNYDPACTDRCREMQTDGIGHK